MRGSIAKTVVLHACHSCSRAVVGIQLLAFRTTVAETTHQECGLPQMLSEQIRGNKTDHNNNINNSDNNKSNKEMFLSFSEI